MRWLGFRLGRRLTHASDYFEASMTAAVSWSKMGLAYVDSLSAEEIREYRGTLTEAGKEQSVP